jgi:hypothetical protein
MSKLEQQKIYADIKPAKRVRITKLKDDVFDGFHPNGIQEGYVKEGILWQAPELGVSCCVGDLYTSVVTEIIDETTFKTRNSTYKIEEI